MYRFGPFEADLSRWELRKHGTRLKVQEQPLRVLEALLEKPGELVSREQLRERLWPSDTFVDFEKSLNGAVAKLRQALSDSAEGPVYVETAARKGYRFIAPVSLVPDAPGELPQTRQTPASGAGASRRWIWIGAAAGTTVIVCLAILYQLRSTLESAGVAGPISFVISMPPNTRLAGRPFAPQMAVSPDGQSTVFVATGPDGAALYLRPMSSESSQRLEGTEEAELPFWAPNGREVGFWSQGKLKTATVSGGAVRVLCDAPQFYGASWSKDGTILFASELVLYRVPAQGGARTQVTFLSRGATQVGTLESSRTDFRHSWPQFLPDGQRFLFFIAESDPRKSGVFLGSLDGGSPQLVFPNATKAMFSPPDFLVYERDATLFAQHWDLAKRRSRGDAVVLAKGVDAFSIGSAGFTLSEAGVLAYRTGSPMDSQLVVRDRDGRRLRTIGPPGPYLQFTVSPDEKLAALSVRLRRDRSSAYKLWLCQLENEVISRLDFGEESQADPVWSPDSKRVAFAAFPVDGMKSRLFQWTVGEAAPQFLFADGNSNKPDDWSPDGKVLLCRRNDVSAFTLPVGDRAEPSLVGDTAYRKDQLHFAPDGRMVAFNAGRPPQAEVFVAAFPGFTGRTQVSSSGGVQPIWRRNGKELFYLAPDGAVMSVAVESGSSLKAGAPRTLFKSGVKWLNQYSDGVSQYAASADGQRFYLLEPVPSPPEGELHIVTNWDARLGR